MEDARIKTDKSRCGCCGKGFQGPSCLIYAAHFLSAWGDRMWHFAVGLYLVYLDNKSLRLVAVYGFSSGGAVLLFGSLIGDWVDRNQRLKVVRTYLFIQNSAVILSAIAILLRLQYENQITYMLDGRLPHVFEFIIIFMAIIAMLASVGCKIAIEKDWIVVVAHKSKNQLANLNATTRAIDQFCKIISPLAVGQVMTFASLTVGAGVIAGWNLVSMFVEYYFLYKVYRKVPELACKKKGGEQEDHSDGSEVEMEHLQKENTEKAENISRVNANVPKNDGDFVDESKKDLSSVAISGNKANNEGTSKPKREHKSTTSMIFERFTMIFKGWPIYMRQKVVFAGLSLAGLYMTVLGFDSITIGYAYSLGIPEWVLGLCMGLGGLGGIIGTIIYPRSRRAIGLERTGLFAFAAETICLTLCVVSVWTPGSPNRMYPGAIPVFKHDPNCTDNAVIDMLNTTSTEKQLQTSSVLNMPYPNATYDHFQMLENITFTTPSSIMKQCPRSRPVVSVTLFLAGIVTSRVGLWMADLTVTQIIQENVDEKNRGVVSGVQSSLNMLLDMLKFLLVIVAPEAETFGILILISFLFIELSFILFCYHSWRVRGHILPFHKTIEHEINGAVFSDSEA